MYLVIKMIIRDNYLKKLIGAKDTEFIKAITGVRRIEKPNDYEINFVAENPNDIKFY